MTEKSVTHEVNAINQIPGRYMPNARRMVNGRDALAKLSYLSPCGKPVGGKSVPYTLETVFGMQIFAINGRDVMVTQEELDAALARRQELILKKKESAEEAIQKLIDSGRKYQFTSTAEVLAAVRRVESKVDRLLAMWGDPTSIEEK